MNVFRILLFQPDGGLRRPDDRDESLDPFSGARLLCAASASGRLRHHALLHPRCLRGARRMSAIYGAVLTAWAAAGICGPLYVGYLKDVYPDRAVMYCFLIGILMLGAGYLFSYLLNDDAIRLGSPDRGEHAPRVPNPASRDPLIRGRSGAIACGFLPGDHRPDRAGDRGSMTGAGVGRPPRRGRRGVHHAAHLLRDGVRVELFPDAAGPAVGMDLQPKPPWPSVWRSSRSASPRRGRAGCCPDSGPGSWRWRAARCFPADTWWPRWRSGSTWCRCSGSASG